VRDAIYRDIDAERERQDGLWGHQQHSWPIWAAILGEESGEVAEVCLTAHWDEHSDLAHLREELVQVAAVAVHIIEKVDAGDRPELVQQRDDS